MKTQFIETQLIDYIDKFETQYLCKPFIDKTWQRICKAVQEYDERCEAYDRIVCSGEEDGIAMPTNGHELALINVHARKVRNGVMDKYYIDWEQLKSGLNSVRC